MSVIITCIHQFNKPEVNIKYLIFHKKTVMRRLSSRESFGCMEFFDFAVLSDGVKSDSGSGGSGNHSLTEEKSEKTRIVGEKNRGKPT